MLSMRRRRMIDPGFWTSYHCKRLTLRQRLLFLGLISNADDDGKLKGDGVYIRSVVFPYDEINKETIETDLQALVNEKMIKCYSVADADDKYIKIRKWLNHQTIRKDRYVESVLPDEIEGGNQTVTTCQPNGNQTVTPSKVKESKVKERKKSPPKKDVKSLKSINSEYMVELKEKFPLVLDIDLELEKYKDWLQQKGIHRKDHRAGFRNWLRSEWVPKKEEKEFKTRIKMCVNCGGTLEQKKTVTFKNEFCPLCTNETDGDWHRLEPIVTAMEIINVMVEV